MNNDSKGDAALGACTLLCVLLAVLFLILLRFGPDSALD
jgi:hypothetical protein